MSLYLSQNTVILVWVSMATSNLKYFCFTSKTRYCILRPRVTHFCSQVAYTFDAGPNACLYLLECEVPKLLSVICHIFPPENEGVQYLQGIPVEKQSVSKVNITLHQFLSGFTRHIQFL
jgi:hypothetical protein